MSAPTIVDDIERAALRDAARQALAGADGPRPIEPGSTYDRDRWRRLAVEFGLQGVRIAERLGGAGLGVAEEMLVHEELGRALSPDPFLATTATVAPALAAIGADEALQQIAAGSLIAASIVDGESIAATLDGQLSGEHRAVIDAQLADGLLVSGRAGDQTVLCWLPVPATGVTITALPSLDLTRRFARIKLDAAQASVLAVGAPADAAVLAARTNRWLALAAESVGLAGAAFDLTLEYVKVRRQFGRPIGGFQAVKHRCADLFVQLESARSALALATSTPSGAALSVARIQCGEAATIIARETVHLHGGMGYTWEHPAHLYYRRATSNQLLLDPHRDQRRHLAAEVAAAYATTRS